MTDLPPPPAAATRPHSYTRHGITIEDPWAWLRAPGYPEPVTDPDVLAYLNAENAYFDAVMAPLKPLTETLFQEMRGRIKEDESTVPQKDGDWLYWTDFETGGEYPRWWRKPVRGGADELILDEPAMAAGKEYFRVGAVSISEDGRLMAYSTDDDGSERYTIRIKDLGTGGALPEAIAGAAGKWGDVSIEGTIGNIVFTSDGSAILYGLTDEHWRTRTIKLHRLGTDPAEDVVVYYEEDQGYSVGVDLSGDRKWIILTASDHTTSEIRLMPAGDPLADPILVSPRQPGREYDVDVHGGTLFIHTNDTHTNWRLATAPIERPGEWTERIAPSAHFYMTGVSCFADFFVVEGREHGLDQIELHKYDPHIAPHRIVFPEASYVAGLGDNPEYAVSKLRLSYQSMVTPGTVYDYEIATGRLETLKVQEIPSGYDGSKYRTERLEIAVRDGTRVPVSIVYPKDFPRDGSGKLYLYSYGAYGIAIPPGFSTSRMSFLDRGVAFAIAHIRGGDDLGQQWYFDGKLEKRTNTFNDFVDCAKGLIALGYTHAGGIAVAGRSAGGELMGAIVNSDPELWGVVVADVPFVDVLNTMLDETLPLTPGEWPEWGNPITDKAAFELIRSYSPYDNVRAQAYPPLYISGGLNDPRVTYWEPAKWAARLRATKTDGNLLVLKINMGAGHGGKSGRWESLREAADEMAFMLWQLGAAD
ncbi:S9 family peptidase [Sphingomonas canadensis]|uniref:S9 family peptidase n=1 Tax=Sphingomonas canadensis TaxID=1219257 RepID=A0ABW3HAH2_9SPHN|nr:S9 family peptidase [Sphingomonas canadensis]MCW3838215.1 S9 family peptidase [Sphingomonas canadensis]